MSGSSVDELEQRVRDLERELEESRRALETLGRSESRYRSLVEHLTHEVHIWELVRDADGAILTWKLDYANPSALASWGRALEEVVGLTTDEIFPGADATAQFLPMIEQTFREQRAHLWEQFFAGTGQTLQMVSIPLGDYFISAGLDVTELKVMEAELRHAHKMEAVGQLAGGIAHDFNNQLAGILGYAELLEASIADETLATAVQRIQSCARRSADLTSQLLAFARKGRAELVAVDLDALIRETADLLSHSVDKSVEIRCALDADGACVRGDSSLLQNAVLNIALNARDAMPEGGELSFESQRVDLDAGACKALGGVLQPGEHVRITIRDTGSGMPPEIADRIFEPFFTTKVEGNGMGLAGVYGTITRHGGSVRVDSAVGSGSRFTIDLPVAGTAGAVEAARVVQEEVAGETALRILIADDERMLCDLCASILSRVGHQVITVNDGEAAVERYVRSWRDIDLVILDVNMPKLNGLEAFRAMKRINPGVRAMIASGYSVERTAEEMLTEGVSGFVQKPFDLKTLVDAVARIR
ncbi:MAG TPA: response regulator [Pseudomonadales bacterium]|nr:response regulator [Pseudomonadales bacterium]